MARIVEQLFYVRKLDDLSCVQNGNTVCDIRYDTKASNAVCSTSRRSWPTRWSSLREEGFPDVWSANPISP